MSECDCYSHDGFLTRKGLREVAERDADFAGGVDMETSQLYLDVPVSVSASRDPRLHWDDAVLEDQHRRFHSGS